MLTYDPPGYRNVDVFKMLYVRLRDRVEVDTLTHAVQAAEDEYLASCQAGNYEYSTRVAVPAGIDSKRTTHMYDKHMRGDAGRDIYDEILENVDGTWKLCSYCGERAGDTADHYKEKAQFPLLAVFPGNIVPACSGCNTNLRGVERKFHPYYDNLDGAIWLRAVLLWDGTENPPGLSFEVDESFSANADLVARVMATFRKARLSKRWSSEISRMIADAHRHFGECKDVTERLNYSHDLRRSYSSPNGPHHMVIDAMLTSDWLHHLPFARRADADRIHSRGEGREDETPIVEYSGPVDPKRLRRRNRQAPDRSMFDNAN